MSDSQKSGKKRKHEKRALTSSSDEEVRPSSSSKKPNQEENERRKKVPSAQTKMQERVKNYLQTSDDRMVDIDKMSKKLYSKYEEYRRRKFREFKKEVEKTFNDLVAQMHQEMTEPEKEPSKNKKDVQVISSSSSSSEDEKESSATKVAGKDMNNTITNLYSTPKTDFDKIKNAAKVAEKSLTNKPNEVITVDDTPKKPTEKEAKKPETKDDTSKREKSAKNEIEMVDLEAEQSKPKQITQAPSEAPTPSKIATKRPTSPTPLKSLKKKKQEAAFKDAKVNFTHVAGMEDTLMTLLELMFGLKADKTWEERTLLLHGPTGCGKTLLANAIAGELKWPLLEVTATEIVSGVSGESEAKLRSLFEQATNAGQPSVLFMDEIEVIGQKKDNSSRGMDNRIIAQLKSCMDSLKGSQVLFVAATNGLESLDLSLRSRFYEVAIGIPNEKARKKIIESVTTDMKLENDFDSAILARNTPSYVGRDYHQLCNQAKKVACKRIMRDLAKNACDLESIRKIVEARETETEAIDIIVKMQDFHSAIKKIQPAAKREGFATIPDVTWKDVGAMEEVREQIELKILARVNHPDAAKDFNLESPTGVLLVGPPGCGKTLVAKAIANQAGINFISVKGPELLNMYVGESEKAVRQVFQRAKNSAPCVVFFDEIDALCPQRTSGSDHSGSNRVVTQMLTEMDGIEGREGVYIMGATNRENIIDPAIKRPGRLETILYVDLPSASDRVSILNAITKNKTRPSMGPDVDFKVISQACSGYSGADLKGLVTKASELAFSEWILDQNKNSRHVTRKHFEHAVQMIRPSVHGKEKQRYEKTKKDLLGSKETQKMDVQEDLNNDQSASQNTPEVNETIVPCENTNATIDEPMEQDPVPICTEQGNKDPVDKPVAENGNDGEKCVEKEQEKEGTKEQEPDKENDKTIQNEKETNDKPVEKVQENGKANKDDSQDDLNNSRSSDKENEKVNSLRFLPKMSVRIKDTNKERGGTFAKVVRQTENDVIISDNKEEITVRSTELEPFMPNPGDKAKSLVPGQSESVFEVLKYDFDDDEAVVVKNLDDNEEHTMRLEILCRVNL